jgi:COP9 signalosome complex subunit 6
MKVIHLPLNYIFLQICEIHESPLFLLMNPGARHADLPLTLYESVIDLVKGEAR